VAANKTRTARDKYVFHNIEFTLYVYCCLAKRCKQ
jgi:hypothetical protein